MERPRRAVRLAAVLISALVAFSIAEVALRLHYRKSFKGGHDTWHEHDPRLGWRHHRSHVARPGPPDVARSFEVRLSSWGLRDDRELAPVPPPGVVRIAAVGDSFTFGYCVDGKDAFPSVLERSLGKGFEVLNYGVSAYGVDQMRLLLDEALEKKPALVLFSVIDANLRRATRVAFQNGEQKPFFAVEDDGSLRLTRGGPENPVPKIEVGESYTRVDAEGSFVVWRVKDAWKRLRATLSDRTNEQSDSWRLGRALILDAARATRAKGARFAVALMPTQSLLGKDRLRRLLPELEAEGIPVCDTYAGIEARLATEPNAPLYVENDGHPSEEGHRIIAAQIKEFLEKRGLLGGRQ